MNKFCLSIVTLLLLVSAGHAFDSNELPYGVYCTKDSFIIDDISVLDDTLGLNFVYGITYSSTVPTMSQAGYDVIKWGSPEWVNPSRTSDYSYFKVEAEDGTSPIRFETRHDIVQGGFLVSSRQDTMLDDLWFGQYPTQAYRGYNERKTFYAQVRLAIDTAGVVLGDTIGRILVHRVDSTRAGIDYWSLRGSVDVLATQELLDRDTIEAPPNPPGFWLCGMDSCAWSYKVKYSFWNSGKTTVYLDYFKSYEEIGERIVETTQYDDSIMASVTGGWKDDVTYWWLRDEPRFDHFMTMAKVRSLVNDATDSLNSITAYLLSSVRASFDATQMQLGLKSFLQITGQDKIVINDYPYSGGTSSYFTDYTGDQEYDMSGPDAHRGLQKQLQLISCKFYDIIRQEMEDDTILTEFWSSPQCVFQVCDSSVGYTPPNTMYRWRPPTHSEHRLNVYLPLCYGARGLALWAYNWGHSSDLWDETCDPWSYGFYLSDTERNAPMWDVFVNDITPYIKAIDSVYMGLSWERAYAYDEEYSQYPPGEAFISSIQAVSNSPDSNPDLGWFQVGEFRKASGVGDEQEAYSNYLMLVNRACSQGMWDPTEAPSVTATVRFNPTNLNLGDYVYVIDLADSVRHAGGDTGWVGIPETTYTAKMPDGTIPFTTTLRAGEGRLFKIANTLEYRPVGILNPNYRYSGKLRPKGDITIPDSQSVTFFAPLLVEFPCYDSSSSGINSHLAELIVEPFADFIVKTTGADSVVFTHTPGCDNPDPNCQLPENDCPRWYGIRLMCAGDYLLDHCRITGAAYGITVKCPNSFRLLNSRIEDCSYSSAWLVNTEYDSTIISYCEFYSAKYAPSILLDNASANMEYSEISNSGNSGLKLIKGTTATNCDCTGFGPDTNVKLVSNRNSFECGTYGLVFDVASGVTRPVLMSTGDYFFDFKQDAVRLTRAANSSYLREGWIKRLDNIDSYNGINLFDTDLPIYGQTVGWACTTYFDIWGSNIGIYCQSGSDPGIKRCHITAPTCVFADKTSLPNLYYNQGRNSLWGQGSGRVYEVDNRNSQTIDARNNYWLNGATINGPVDTSDAVSEDFCSGWPKIVVESSPTLPKEFALNQNYPNPFNSSTVIEFSLPEASAVTIQVYNILGQKVRTLADNLYPPGVHLARWDGRNQAGMQVSSGLYFLLVQTDTHTACKKMTLLR